MKLVDLITLLNELLDKHGNVDLYTSDLYGHAPVVDIEVHLLDNDGVYIPNTKGVKPSGIILDLY